jgi:hypothetical protein
MKINPRLAPRAALALATLALACNRKGDGGEATEQRAENPPIPAETSPRPAPPPVDEYPVPMGPVLGIFRGEGVGAIRFGANVGTIERLMEAPCDEKSETVCRYYGQAVEFVLDESLLTREIRIHRTGRHSEPGLPTFGHFNGRFPEGANLNMLPSAIEELIGQPNRVEDVTDPSPRRVGKIYHYDDMRLEFDRIENGNLVLGGVILLRPST